LIVAGADVLRMSVWSGTEPLPPDLPVIQIGLLDWEMGKNYPAEMALRSDLKETLAALIPVLERTGGAALKQAAEARLQAIAAENWTAKGARLREATAGKAAVTPIANDWLMMRIADALPPEAIVVNEGLTAAFSLLDFLPFRDRYGYHAFASGGIGWALPAAVGVQLAHPDRPVVAVIGDGSAMYSIQALWTASHLKLPLTYVIANNQGYRILKQRLRAFHGNDRFIGMNLTEPEIDFVALARSLGMTAERVTEPDAVAPTLEAAIASEEPTLLDVSVERDL
jgi:benzoylformate decarboxylase